MPRSGRCWKPCPSHPPASQPPGLPRHTGTSAPLATDVAGPTFERRTVGDRHPSACFYCVGPNVDQVHVARGGSGAPRGGPWLARETPAGCPRHASPARAIALLGEPWRGLGQGHPPCIDGLSLASGMVVPQHPACSNHPEDDGRLEATWPSEAAHSWRKKLVREGRGGGIRSLCLGTPSTVILGVRMRRPAVSSCRSRPPCPPRQRGSRLQVLPPTHVSGTVAPHTGLRPLGRLVADGNLGSVTTIALTAALPPLAARPDGGSTDPGSLCRGVAGCGYLSLPCLSLPGLSLLGLPWRPSLSLPALLRPLLGRSTGSVRCLAVEASPSARSPEPVDSDAVGWLLGGWAASAAPRARPGPRPPRGSPGLRRPGRGQRRQGPPVVPPRPPGSGRGGEGIAR